MVEFIENPYRSIHWSPQTDTRSAAFVVVIDQDVELHPTLSEAMDARDRLEIKHRTAHVRNREKARWRQPREYATAQPNYLETRAHAY